MKYRPWGPVKWVLSLSGEKQWGFAGVLGTEERSLCSWELLRQESHITRDIFVQISDVDSVKYRDLAASMLANRRDEYANQGGDVSSIRNLELMAEFFQISTFAQEVESLGSSVILDITSFPKRFFFVILKRLIYSNTIKNLIITYTSPSNYADGDLYEDIEPWRTLPGFNGGNDKPELWIVSVGFLVESLRQYVGGNPQEKMKILIPFPAPLTVLRRTWQSVAYLEESHSHDRFEKSRVETLNMSAAFDRICSLAGKPPKELAFAPFGPKPTSAAMCIYALQRNSSVHYPQPTVYHPEYTKGIRNDDPKVAVNAYWVKHEGEFLYQI